MYGEDKIVRALAHSHTLLNPLQVLKPRPGKLGLGCVVSFSVVRGLTAGAQDRVYSWAGLLYGRLCDHHGRRLFTPRRCITYAGRFSRCSLD